MKSTLCWGLHSSSVQTKVTSKVHLKSIESTSNSWENKRITEEQKKMSMMVFNWSFFIVNEARGVSRQTQDASKMRSLTLRGCDAPEQWPFWTDFNNFSTTDPTSIERLCKAPEEQHVVNVLSEYAQVWQQRTSWLSPRLFANSSTSPTYTL